MLTGHDEGFPWFILSDSNRWANVSMRGSQWEREGRGPGIGLEKVLVAVGILVAVSVLAVYYIEVESVPASAGTVTTITTTGAGCGGGSIPQAAVAVEEDARFVALSGGLCYDYIGENSSGGVPVLTFDRYNGTIVYECGTTAYDVVEGQIEANITSAGAVGSIWTQSQGLNPPRACPAPPPVSVVSVDDVGSLVPAVPELKVTLQAGPGAQTITSLKASLTLVGGTQQFVFVAHPATLAPGGQVSKSQITSSSTPFSSGILYPMTVTGTFADGQAFTVQAYVQVAGIP